MGYIENLLELGITTMDHARVYNSEAQFGKALKLKPSLREKLEIISKCGIVLNRTAGSKVNHYDFRQQSIIASVEETLTELQTSYIDILLLHRPDYLMQVDEVAEAFERLRHDGKVRYFGVSNFTAAQFDLLNNSLPPPSGD